MLTKATKEKNQDSINMYAYELTTRVYVPNSEYTFEDMLMNFGYKIKEKEIKNQISIDECMKENEKNECRRKRKKNNRT